MAPAGEVILLCLCKASIFEISKISSNHKKNSSTCTDTHTHTHVYKYQAPTQYKMLFFHNKSVLVLSQWKSRWKRVMPQEE